MGEGGAEPEADGGASAGDAGVSGAGAGEDGVAGSPLAMVSSLNCSSSSESLFDASPLSSSTRDALYVLVRELDFDARGSSL